MRCKIRTAPLLQGVPDENHRYRLFTVPPRWLFLKISTDEGISGWGEPIVEARAATTPPRAPRSQADASAANPALASPFYVPPPPPSSNFAPRPVAF